MLLPMRLKGTLFRSSSVATRSPNDSSDKTVFAPFLQTTTSSDLQLVVATVISNAIEQQTLRPISYLPSEQGEHRTARSGLQLVDMKALLRKETRSLGGG